MAIHSSIFAWKIPQTEEPSRLQSMGSQSQTRLSVYYFLHINTNDISTIPFKLTFQSMGLLRISDTFCDANKGSLSRGKK